MLCCGPTISLGQVEGVLAVGWMLGGGGSTESIYLLYCKVGERKANANACKNSNQATVTGSRGRDEGARGRLGWEKAPGRKGELKM
jgi:hypothetical protein